MQQHDYGLQYQAYKTCVHFIDYEAFHFPSHKLLATMAQMIIPRKLEVRSLYMHSSTVADSLSICASSSKITYFFWSSAKPAAVTLSSLSTLRYKYYHYMNDMCAQPFAGAPICGYKTPRWPSPWTLKCEVAVRWYNPGSATIQLTMETGFQVSFTSVKNDPWMSGMPAINLGHLFSSLLRPHCLETTSPVVVN